MADSVPSWQESCHPDIISAKDETREWIYTMNSTNVYIGVDPGVSGGIAVLGPTGEVIELTKTPPTELGLWYWLCRYSPEYSTVGDYKSSAVIEKITPGHIGSNKTSVAKLYGSYKALRMALTCADIHTTAVAAVTWHAALGIEKRRPDENESQWKGRLKGVAMDLCPDQKITLATADALLIAVYCYRLRTWKLTK